MLIISCIPTSNSLSENYKKKNWNISFNKHFNVTFRYKGARFLAVKKKKKHIEIKNLPKKSFILFTCH